MTSRHRAPRSPSRNPHLAKGIAVHPKPARLVPPTPLLTRLQGRGPVELGLLTGAALLLLGVGYVLWAVESWREAGFGDLPPHESVRIVVPAVTAIAIGIQLAFSGFVLATIEFGRELRLRRAQT